MVTLTTTNVRLINTYLALVPTPYKLGERRLLFDKVGTMTNSQLTTFLTNKIGDADVKTRNRTTNAHTDSLRNPTAVCE